MAKKIVIGIDIEPSRKTFSVAIFKQGERSIRRLQGLSVQDLISLIKEVNPSMIAVDNIFELGSASEIFSIFENFPGVEIIQVTGPPFKGLSLQKIAKMHNLPIPRSSIQEAETAAVLAHKGCGCKVKLFEDECEIIVSRGRSPGRGGSSALRLARMVEAKVATVTNEIASILKKNKIAFDMYCEESKFGVKRALFNVYVPYRVIHRVLRGLKGSQDVNVEIKPVRRRRITFIEEGKESKLPSLPKRKLIVGIDPGMTTAIAIFDLDMRLLHTESKKEFHMDEIISRILFFGVPLIIGVDVNPPPQLAKQIASKFNAVLSYPPRNLSSRDKMELLKKHFAGSISELDVHERDAISAAIRAFLTYKRLFETVDRVIDYLSVDIDREEVKSLIVRNVNLKDAIRKVLLGEIGSKKSVKKIDEKLLTSRIETLKKQISERDRIISLFKEKVENLEREIEKYRRREKALLGEIEKLNQKISKLKSDVMREKTLQDMKRQIESLRSYIRKLESENRNLREQINIMNSLRRRAVKGEITILVPVPKFTSSVIDDLIEKGLIQDGDVVLLEDASGGGKSTALNIVKKRIKAIIVMKSKLSDQALEIFEKYDIPVIDGEFLKGHIKLEAGTYYIATQKLEEAVDAWKKKVREQITRDLKEIILEERFREYTQ